ncbi:MAG: glycosyltransferase [Acidobacteriota bacterium]|jgi:glycosyltransferase involved in cell wall biosynthesis|nr:glycosyltransferase [Acidobacteriota bacterium]
MDSAIKLSIIIPAYNTAALIGRCLESVFDQDLPTDDFEVIVVNDGSMDNTLEVIENFAKDKNNVKVFSQENKRQGAARNLGLRHARGEYIWFIDSDDYIEANCYRKIYEKANSSKLDILSFGSCRINTDTNYREDHFCDSKYDSVVMRGEDALVKRLVPITICHLFHHSFLVDNDLYFREQMVYEDNEFIIKSYYYAQRVSFVRDIFYYYNITTPSTTRSTSSQPIFDLIKATNHTIDFCNSIQVGVQTRCAMSFYAIIAFNCIFDKLKQQGGDVGKEVIRKILPMRKKLVPTMLLSFHLKYCLEAIVLAVSVKLLLTINNMRRC